MKAGQFFARQSTPSRVKADIVAKYFTAWARIVAPHALSRGEPVAFLDLFAGPGRYEDGAESTPLLVLRRAIEDRKLRNILVTRFNDVDPAKVSALRREIAALPGVHLLRHTPMVCNYEFDTDVGRDVRETRFPPTLFFVDPFGYKGLTRDLIHGALKDWGCEVIFFFNFNRVNAALTNDCVGQHIDELFGEEEAGQLRRRVEGLAPHDREQAVIDQLVQSIRAGGSRYVQHFAFTDARGTRTSHYLVHVTKKERGYHIMKDIMAGASSWDRGGVASFVCGPRPMPTLLDVYETPLDELKRDLLSAYSGKSKLFGDLWEEHALGRAFTERNYRDAILQLEEEGRVFVEVPSGRTRRVGTVPATATVHFTTATGPHAGAP